MKHGGSAERLTLEQFICEMMRLPPDDLSVSDLSSLFGRLDLRDQTILDHIRFADERYTRNLVCRTPRFELLVLGWRPGQASTIHDHGGALSASRVFRGRLTSRGFAPEGTLEDARSVVRLAEEEHLDMGALATVDRGGIHQLANTDERELVTVHVYARPLTGVYVYDPQAARREKVRLRYTLEDDLGV